jgi:putative ATP-dependent endonuclease of the OLD family
MHISTVKIENFRNFENVTIKTGKNLLLVGANGTGKSNFIHALRLVLDSTLSRRDRRLSTDDFWRGENLSPWGGRIIRVTIEISGYQDNRNLRSYLDDFCLDEPGTAIITYEFRPRGNVNPESSLEADYEPRIYGGSDESVEVPSQFFDHFNLRVIDALRDAERELNARRMPLKALLELYGIDGDSLQDIVEYIEAANKRLENVPSVQTLETDIRERLLDLQEHINEGCA